MTTRTATTPHATSRVRHPPGAVNADLHAHSIVSDGTLTPAALVARAAQQGVSLFSLTDHDELGGLAEARAAARVHGLQFVDGVEISVTWAGKTVHVVGLGIDPEAGELAQRLAALRAGRRQRAEAIALGLERAGVPDTLDAARAYAANPELVSRTHFARLLVARGVEADLPAAFGRWLLEGRPGYVRHAWAGLDEAVGWIVDAGGVAVLAHPGRYGFDDLRMDALIVQFKAAGGTALEVGSGNHDPGQVQRFAALALAHGLEGSRGSDFHGPGESRVELGAAPRLPRDLVPVWRRFV